ncbi:10397_t:CDS:2 [Dentiscutata erythropus]|uniref:10397_t:CDS:1 n=1 Tax=Dentiscutata erythropus TaxID=1348616 RepID=A0A9N9EZI0_9GLOM|nr:10397_t:CDS:2 [Dentiscutata erythropus]
MNFFHWGEFDPNLTVNSWFVSPKTLKIFRLVVAIYSWIIVIGDLLDYGLRPQELTKVDFGNDAECFLCYFTNLSYIGQTIYFTTALFYSFRSNSLENFSKLHNFLFWILYHTFVHYHLLSKTFIKANKPWYVWWLNISVHGVEFVTMLIELFLNRQIMKISFIFITISIQILYTFETFLIYDTHRGFWVYEFLDWHKDSPGIVSLHYIGRKHSKKSSDNVSDPQMSTVDKIPDQFLNSPTVLISPSLDQSFEDSDAILVM